MSEVKVSEQELKAAKQIDSIGTDDGYRIHLAEIIAAHTRHEGKTAKEWARHYDDCHSREMDFEKSHTELWKRADDLARQLDDAQAKCRELENLKREIVMVLSGVLVPSVTDDNVKFDNSIKQSIYEGQQQLTALRQENEALRRVVEAAEQAAMAGDCVGFDTSTQLKALRRALAALSPGATVAKTETENGRGMP